VDLAYHGREHVAVLQVEIVVRTIEVSRHHGYVVGAVLQVEALAHLKTGNLSDSVRLVGVFKRRGEQTILRHRLWSLARIDASRTEEEEFLHAVLPTLADDILLNLQVFIDEVRAISEVCHDASNVGCGKHYSIGLLLIEELLDSNRVEQIKLLVSTSHKVVVTARLEVVPYSGTY
jgi:hypothetical protein